MGEAVYVRFDEEELEFINRVANEGNISRSKAIKNLVDYASQRMKLEKALQTYKDGKATIREAAQEAGLRYFEFFDLLAKDNLLGTSQEHVERVLQGA
ncbi:hypothetical protein HYU14_00775 [Candidatus Woesearchaeota archaeon]|nr:hypothetical protein [Candidatus Woesearchaeota archaeon]